MEAISKSIAYANTQPSSSISSRHGSINYGSDRGASMDKGSYPHEVREVMKIDDDLDEGPGEIEHEEVDIFIRILLFLSELLLLALLSIGIVNSDSIIISNRIITIMIIFTVIIIILLLSHQLLLGYLLFVG